MYLLFDEQLRNKAEYLHHLYRSLYSGKMQTDYLKVIQEKSLQRVLQNVIDHSPFYQRRLAQLKDTNLSVFQLQDLPSLPFTTKDDLRNEQFDMLSEPLWKAAIFYETTGTTGKATPCPRGPMESIQSNMGVTFNLDSLFEPGREDVVGACGPTEMHSFGDTTGDVFRNLGKAVVKMWPFSPMVGLPRAVQTILETGMTVLVCTPGMAMTIAKEMRSKGIDIKKQCKIDTLLLTGELSSKSLLLNLENIYGARAYNFLYGSQETMVVATCTKEQDLKGFPLNYIYEVIDKTGQLQTEVDADGFLTGELVVTMLIPGVKPLIRYRTGDMVRYKEPTGDTAQAPQLVVLGRDRDEIRLGDHSISAYDLEQLLLSSFTDLVDYQVVIEEIDGQDQITVLCDTFESNPALFAKQSEACTEAVKQALGIPARAVLSEIGILSSTGALVSWKAARVLDKRNQAPDLEQEAAQSIARSREKATA